MDPPLTCLSMLRYICIILGLKRNYWREGFNLRNTNSRVGSEMQLNVNKEKSACISSFWESYDCDSSFQ